jgi:hypothetical protein
MSRVGILKPDHLGDLVLATPAIRAIAQHFGDPVLYVGSPNVSLARFLFPRAEIRTVSFPHLAKSGGGPLDVQRLANDLNQHRHVFCLRDDPVLRSIVDGLDTDVVTVQGSHETHETAIQKDAVCQRVPNYSRTSLFSGRPVLWPSALARVALCIAAGYPTNRWPNACWLELATALVDRGIEVTFVGGPGERKDLALLSASMGQLPHRIVHGGADFAAFYAGLADVDLVIASDGGTAHLCSLAKPVLSIFGSSPWRRYAPFGWSNVLLTRDVPCSPCVQFSTDMVNGCLTRECINAIKPAQVVRVLESNGLDFSQVRGLKVVRGVSHMFER